MPTCDSLSATLVGALDDATSCNACDDGPNPCAYLSGPQLTDVCGCPVAVNGQSAEAVGAALDAWNAWRDAGCGPLDCGTPCAISNMPFCSAPSGSCAGHCGPF
jgi:hypothetical protein